MQPQRKTNILIAVGVSLNILALAAVVGTTISNKVTSQNKIDARRKSLVDVVKHVKVQTCWVTLQPEPFKIGDAVTTSGTTNGKIPTTCVRAPKTNQYLMVGYANGQLQVTQAFSNTEIQNQKSLGE
jgi:hypothetical protein